MTFVPSTATLTVTVPDMEPPEIVPVFLQSGESIPNVTLLPSIGPDATGPPPICSEMLPPGGGCDGEADKRAVYRIADPYVAFWRRFVSPVVSAGMVGLAPGGRLWKHAAGRVLHYSAEDLYAQGGWPARARRW